jgi:hypothetical protein
MQVRGLNFLDRCVTGIWESLGNCWGVWVFGCVPKIELLISESLWWSVDDGRSLPHVVLSAISLRGQKPPCLI